MKLLVGYVVFTIVVGILSYWGVKTSKRLPDDDPSF